MCFYFSENVTTINELEELLGVTYSVTLFDALKMNGKVVKTFGRGSHVLETASRGEALNRLRTEVQRCEMDSSKTVMFGTRKPGDTKYILVEPKKILGK